mmetsp:Transcript_34564/g.73641  ORF Transcript_34564/g.73641 Transcript_34564/m.73641 type:complete len:259 (+) Transcript_34564:185-961(+)|eukprot:CAMPEP_0172531460 /NCGR_PEP_ID=MMETSP1067-20121228/4864_1 /TAXON_ID=265564 ORGANISM="Thalassiosira punctigera, Strain Tpunct2005C2" /NCGR_SAMPLE_ID=MMETSP1067 /ASSEMBLY_ACC=CAM_ASM_000444 /LENGTH=258 /DNA_ID=CAMNT_0013315845 /DNA_START=89 /DNA_END=865 /DNA_ORIENTATION=-
MNRPNFNYLRHASKAVVIAVALSQSLVLSFTAQNRDCSPSKLPYLFPSTRLHGISKWNEEYQSAPDDEDDELITKEMFLRDMLSETARRKKKGSKEYKPHDNRDALPFVVKVKTPDPYTPSGEMLDQARKNTEAAKKKNTTESKKKGPRRSNLVGMDSSYANAIASSIYARKKNGTLYKVLGSFELDKNTNCGDILQVGDREFEVVTARSQFKYAGGRRFVMVRKILEVKDITRIAEEASLKRLIAKGSESVSGKNFE